MDDAIHQIFIEIYKLVMLSYRIIYLILVLFAFVCMRLLTMRKWILQYFFRCVCDVTRWAIFTLLLFFSLLCQHFREWDNKVKWQDYSRRGVWEYTYAVALWYAVDSEHFQYICFVFFHIEINFVWSSSLSTK